MLISAFSSGESVCQLLANRLKGAGGRGEALRFAAPPQGGPGVIESGLQILQILSFRQTPPLPPAPLKSDSKIDQKSNLKKNAIFSENWSPRDPRKTPKSQKVRPNPLPDASRSPFAARSGKKSFLDLLREVPMWLPYSK